MINVLVLYPTMSLFKTMHKVIIPNIRQIFAFALYVCY